MKRLLAAAFLLLTIHFVLFGQAASQVSGVVTDPSGAVVPAAIVQLESVETGLKRVAKTDTAAPTRFSRSIRACTSLR